LSLAVASVCLVNAALFLALGRLLWIAFLVVAVAWAGRSLYVFRASRRRRPEPNRSQFDG
jgi:Flp pilus assembly protein TadB